MKNPFNSDVFVISPGATEAYYLAHKITPDSIRTTALTKEQAEYAAHAINLHDRRTQALYDLCQAIEINLRGASGCDDIDVIKTYVRGVLDRAEEIAAALLAEEGQ